MRLLLYGAIFARAPPTVGVRHCALFCDSFFRGCFTLENNQSSPKPSQLSTGRVAQVWLMVQYPATGRQAGAACGATVVDLGIRALPHARVVRQNAGCS